MSSRFSLIPQYIARSLDDITAQFLKDQGIRFVMLDLDNTIAAYDETEPSLSVKQWIDDIRKNGISLFLISNSSRDDRVKSFTKPLGISFIMYARKPLPNALRHAMSMANVTAQVSALIGDQVYTDALAANLAGVMPILIRPRKFTNPFLALRYFLELPFRPRRKLLPEKQTTQETTDESNNENSKEIT